MPIPDRSMRLSLLLIALAWLAPASAWADGVDIDQISLLPAKVFDESDGLPDPTVMSVAPDPDGHVWVGTMRGLARFNGQRMTPVPGPQGRFNASIRAVTVTPDGQVWVSVVREGVFVRIGAQWQSIGIERGLPGEYALKLRWFADGKGYRMFATTNGGVAEWDGKNWRPRALPRLLANVEIFDVLLDREAGRAETLWLASFGHGLFRCTGQESCLPVVQDAPGPRFFEISSLDQWRDSDGVKSLWVGSYGGGIAKLRDGRWTRYYAAKGDLASDYVHQLLVQDLGASQPQIWAGTRGGAARMRGGRWEPLEYLSRGTGARIRALALARDAMGRPQVWLGSDFGAARLRLQGSWRTVSEIGRSGNGVWSVLFEESAVGSERLWLGSDGEGMARYENGQWTRWNTGDGLPSPTVRSLARVQDGSAEGELWVGTWNGHLLRMRGDKLQEIPTPWDKTEREAVAKILPVATNEAWIGLRQGGVAHYRDGRWQHFDPARMENPQRVVSLLQTGSGEETVLWASTVGRGLAALYKGRWSFHGKAEGLPDDSYYGITLIPDASGRQILWLGSFSNGVVRVDITNPARPVWVRLPVLPTPPNPYVYGVVRDGAGDLILCSDYGAARWRPLPDGGFDSLRFQRSDGLPHDECNAGALQTDVHGRVWAGTIGGAAVYLPRSPTSKAAPASLVIDRALVDGSEITTNLADGKLVLAADARTLELDYVLLSGDRESLNRYRSWLEGLEPTPRDWTASSSRSFTGLPPGHYTLHVEARDYLGQSAVPLALRFEIPLPWWRQTGALAVFIGIGLLLAFAVLRLRERHLRVRETELVQLVGERTQQLENRSQALRHANEELTRLSYFDVLTELANRRRLLERLQEEWTVGLARQTPVAFALFDLDEFKAYNDMKGHLAGDEALRVVARRVEAELRKPHDTAGRYGGEEFGVVLPGLDIDAASVVAERVRLAVQHSGLGHPGSRQGVVTISIGVAAMVPRRGMGAELLIAAADAALYRAKKLGKNRVEAARSEPA